MERRFEMAITDAVKKESVTKLEFGVELDAEVFALRWLERH